MNMVWLAWFVTPVITVEINVDPRARQIQVYVVILSDNTIGGFERLGEFGRQRFYFF